MKTGPKHPVLELMHARKKTGSKPSKRTDTAKLALVIEGGGMRGIVSAGMTAAIEQLGFLETIDEVYGTSAGALNGAFLLAGQATWSCTLYYDYLNKERFLDLSRILLGKPAIDMEWLTKDAYARERRLNYEAILANPIPLHCMTTEIETGKTVNLTGHHSKADIESALLATSRIPFLVGDPHEHKGYKYIDAGLTEPIPIEAALSGAATHILILQTRPKDVHLKESVIDPIVERYLKDISPALEDLYEERFVKYERIQRLIDIESQNDEHQPAICNVNLPAGSEMIGSLEKEATKLIKGAGEGLRVMQELLTDEPVIVEQVVRAFPAKWYNQTIKS